jgi:hypothetical protein
MSYCSGYEVSLGIWYYYYVYAGLSALLKLAMRI